MLKRFRILAMNSAENAEKDTQSNQSAEESGNDKETRNGAYFVCP